MKKNKNEEGYVLVVTIIIVAAVLLLVTAMSSYLDSELGFYKSNSNLNKAFYGAEAGVAYGSGEVFENNDLWSLNPDDPDDKLKYLSDAELGNLNTKLEDAVIISISRTSIYSSDTPAPLTDDNDIPYVNIKAVAEMNGTTKQVTGSFHYMSGAFFNAISVGDTMTFNNNAYVEGDVSAPDGDSDISYKNNFELDGEAKSAIYDVTFEKEEFIDEDSGETYDFYLDKEAEGYSKENYDLISDLAATSTSAPADYDLGSDKTYIKGNAKLNQTITGSGVLFIDGNLTLGNNFSLNEDSDDFFYIIVNGNIEIDNGNKNTIKGFIYASEDITFKNAVKIEGSIYAGGSFTSKNTDNTDEPDFIYNPGFLDNEDYVEAFKDKPAGAGEPQVPNKMIDWIES